MRNALGPILVSLALVLAMGVVHGIYTDRWGRSAQLEEALAALPRVPMNFGGWVGEEHRAIDPRVMEIGEIQGAVVRRYHNTRTGETVSLLIVCGRGGPISVHTPDVCYEGAGYRQLAPEEPKELTVGQGPSDTFNVARFGKPGVVPMQMEIYWGWSVDGRTWQAPRIPRASLARSRALYKMYITREFAPGSPAESAETCEAFLREALPALRQALPHATN